MSSWRKRGRVFDPEKSVHWTRSHAALPFATPLEGDRYRVYCSGRDDDGRSSIGFVDVTFGSVAHVDEVASAPVVSPGKMGAFDDSGVTMSCLVRAEDRLFVYYTGWSLGITVPFYLAIGLAVSEDGGETFRRLHEAPIMGRSPSDPYLVASPSVLVESGRWRMWYVSATEWRMVDGSPRHYYNIRHAESDDGVEWHPDGRVCLDFEGPSEYAFGRPCVIRTEVGYEMWFCVRGSRYRLGYARSADGLSWERRGEPVGLAPSDEGWDAEMMAYPSVFQHDGRKLVLYNGNGYGRTGFGWAEEAVDSAGGAE